MAYRFDERRYFRTNDAELEIIAARGTLAIWRHQGRGPRYLKFGNRVLYLGADLNAWLDQHAIEPKPHVNSQSAA